MASGDQQSQRAGNNAQQIQIFGNAYVGVTEERAREIAHEQALRLISEYSLEAAKAAQSRSEVFNDKLIAYLTERHALPAFADPSFHVPLRNAFVGATATESEDEYELLIELLGGIAEPTSRFRRASLNRAIEIVPDLDSDALRALCLLECVWTIQARRWITETFKRENERYAVLLDRPLPVGSEFLDHLEGFGLVRRSDEHSSVPTYYEMFVRNAPAYAGRRIETSSAIAYLDYAEQQTGIAFPLCEDELDPERQRFAFPNESELRHWLSHQSSLIRQDAVVRFVQSEGFLSPDVARYQIELERMASLFDSVQSVSDWWGALAGSFVPTALGATLAKANLDRISRASWSHRGGLGVVEQRDQVSRDASVVDSGRGSRDAQA